MGIITLVLLLSLETFYLIWSVSTKNNHREEKSIIGIAILILFGLLLATGVFEWGFRYMMLLVVLTIQALAGIIILIIALNRLRGGFHFTFFMNCKCGRF